jgi:hypothetical protein
MNDLRHDLLSWVQPFKRFCNREINSLFIYLASCVLATGILVILSSIVFSEYELSQIKTSEANPTLKNLPITRLKPDQTSATSQRKQFQQNSEEAPLSLQIDDEV